MKSDQKDVSVNSGAVIGDAFPLIPSVKNAALLFTVLVAGCLTLTAQNDTRPVMEKPQDRKTQQQWLDSLNRLPMSFEANQGQTDYPVAFVSRGSGYTLFLTHDEAVFSLKSSGIQPTATVRMHFTGANHDSVITGQDELVGKSNYFVGNDPKRWHIAVPTFSKVENHSLYQGIDLVYYGNQQKLEYDLRVAPGADAGQIRFNFHADHNVAASSPLRLRVDAAGNLVNSAHPDEVLLAKPVAYQMSTNESGTEQKTVVEATFVVSKSNEVGFEIGAYDRSRTLIIDPVVPFYSTYLGGAANDYGYGIAVDAKGNAYVTGSTASLNFPVLACLQCVNAGGLSDAFVTEINPGGLVYSTYLGGKGNDYGYGIAVDGVGNAYVTGSTSSVNFPVVACFQCVFQGGAADAFVTEIAAGGAGLLYSTYLGGKGNDYGRAIAVDPFGDAFVTGNTTSKNFPVPACVFGCALAGLSDAFVTELKAFAAGGIVAPIYSDYLGGNANDYGYGIAVDPNQNAYVTGATSSVNFPTTAPACFQCAPLGLSDAFVTHIAPFGTALVNSTYLGGPTNDYGYAIAIDGQHTVYVTGSTGGPFPLGPCFQCVYGGGVSDAFVTRLDPTLTGIIYSTYLGGAGTDAGRGIAVDAMGDADVTGNTSSRNFPVANCFQCLLNGGTDAFVTSLTAPGVAVVYSTYLGGKANDYGRGIAVNLAFNPTAAYVTGYTNSPNFPIIGGFPPAGLNDAFVTGLP